VDVDGLTSLDEERMLELAGVDKEDFCEWAATRTGCLKLIVWALERDFPWGGYPPSCRERELRRVTRGELTRDSQELNDVLALRAWRAMCPELQDDVAGRRVNAHVAWSDVGKLPGGQTIELIMV